MAAPIPLVFYRTPAGSEPVREWLKDLPPEDRKIVGQDLRRQQFRWPVGMPLARSLGKACGKCAPILTMARSHA